MNSRNHLFEWQHLHGGAVGWVGGAEVGWLGAALEGRTEHFCLVVVMSSIAMSPW